MSRVLRLVFPPAASIALALLLHCSPAPDPSEDWQIGPFLAHPGNPILSPRGETWESKDVFNPAVWTDGREVLMLYRAEDRTGLGQWNGTSRIGLARSRDGIHFQREPEPVLIPTEPWELPGGCEDPRLVRIDGTFYLTYTAYDGETARLALATSDDLRAWEKRGLLFPERGWTKSGAILDKPRDGRYWMYFGDTDVWAAHSADLLDWTVLEEPVLKRRPGFYDSRVVEPGPPPLTTRDGILLIYNGADADLRYSAGQALFDAQHPLRLLQRSSRPFLQPDQLSQTEGQVPRVVFAQGLVRFQQRWLLYFGMADSYIGVALTP